MPVPSRCLTVYRKYAVPVPVPVESASKPPHDVAAVLAGDGRRRAGDRLGAAVEKRSAGPLRPILTA